MICYGDAIRVRKQLLGLNHPDTGELANVILSFRFVGVFIFTDIFELIRMN